ncbi:unnamed protein product [Blepharisma stoltei]|uniref:Uncharacterized protein n=1 Tax=Blepharisma stoltei TaxID=1481888 RepID=A0AAU9JAK8_9CILI|nr:unnamed protein product [Blepharisma stoltei]
MEETANDLFKFTKVYPAEKLKRCKSLQKQTLKEALKIKRIDESPINGRISSTRSSSQTSFKRNLIPKLPQTLKNSTLSIKKPLSLPNTDRSHTSTPSLVLKSKNGNSHINLYEKLRSINSLTLTKAKENSNTQFKTFGSKLTLHLSSLRPKFLHKASSKLLLYPLSHPKHISHFTQTDLSEEFITF